MEKVKLEDISAKITSGYNINRVKAETEKGYSYKMITVKSMYDGNFIQEDLKEVYLEKEASTEHLTKEGDIIIKILSPIEFLYITKEMEGILVPINFYILRVNENIVMSGYLASYLKNIKKTLDLLCVGTSAMKKTSIKELKEIEVIIPSLKFQEEIIAVQNLYQKEIELFNLKNQFYKSTLNQLFREALKK